jgi:ubiquitin-like modifier-activating enzyme ATG7
MTTVSLPDHHLHPNPNPTSHTTSYASTSTSADTSTDSSSSITYKPFQSAIDINFWTTFAKQKLDRLTLNEEPLTIYAYYTVTTHTELQPSLIIDSTSLQYINDDTHTNTTTQATDAALHTHTLSSTSSSSSLPSIYPKLQYHVTVKGTLYNRNTFESFKQYDTQGIVHRLRDRLWKSIVDGSIIHQMDELMEFILLSYADLKSHIYYYFCCIPSLVCNELNAAITNTQLLSSFDANHESSTLPMLKLIQQYLHQHPHHAYFFLQHHAATHQYTIHSFHEYQHILQQSSANSNDMTFCYVDSTTDDTAYGWPLRNLLLVTAVTLQLQSVRILAFRDMTTDMSSTTPTCMHSIKSKLLTINLSASNNQPLSTLCSLPSSSLKVIGWERNKQGKLAPRSIDLSSFMTPTRLAENSIDLNLKLMRWRLLPALDLPTLTGSKCLLLGAGTLGCNVARCLLGWNITHITFVDNGKVSFSNPVRQSLFTFADCLNGGKAKAMCAADALKSIYPSVQSAAYNFTIPMAGHAVTANELERTVNDISLLTSLIEQHDVIFLLTDSRESRYLPTVICKAKNKLCINAALGFDNFLVMRHGVSHQQQHPTLQAQSASASTQLHQAHEDVSLGCYFCTDVVAPVDSLRDRTLDQQCTVTRPGLAYIAAAEAVELAVACLHHPLKQYAPAINEVSDELNGFGCLPHTIRGFLSRFQQTIVTGQAFKQCTACSEVVIHAYNRDGIDFVLNVMNQPASYLEELSGVAALKREADKMLADAEMSVDMSEDGEANGSQQDTGDPDDW